MSVLLREAVDSGQDLPARSRAKPGRSSPRGGIRGTRARRVAIALDVGKETVSTGVCPMSRNMVKAPRTRGGSAHVHRWWNPRPDPDHHRRRALDATVTPK